MSPVSVTQAATALSNTGSVMECLPCEDSAARLAARMERLSTIAKSRGSAFRRAETPGEPVIHWEGVLGVEGEMTGDGRLIQPSALRWDDLPIPLRHVGADVGAHQGAEVSGRILSIERRPGGIIWGGGDFDLESDLGREAARKVEKKLMNGVSMDLDDVAFEVRVAAEAAALVVDGLEPLALDAENADADGRVSVKEVSPDDEVMVTTGARVRAATQVAVPAFSRAKIELTDAGRAALKEANAAVLVASAARRRRQVFDKGGHLPKAARTTLSVEPLPAAPPEAVCAHDGCDLSPVFAVSSSEPGIDVLYCGTHASEHEDGPLPAATLDLLTEPALAAEMILNAVTPPPFVATIAAALVTRGRESEKALSTALATVSRWAAGGSVAVHGGPAVDLGTQAKAAEALAQLEGADANGTFNWVDDVGGLPRKIRDIADAIMKKGTPEGHAIAIAVNAVKKGCATGDLNFPGKQDMNPVSRADYCAAVAEWEAKKAAAKADAAVAMPLAVGWTLYTAKALTAAGGWRKQWRNPANGQWIDMPGEALGSLIEMVEQSYKDDPSLDSDRATLDGAIGELPQIKAAIDADLAEGDYDSITTDVQTVLDGFPFEDYDDPRSAKAKGALEAYVTDFVPEEQTDLDRDQDTDIGAGDDGVDWEGDGVARKSDKKVTYPEGGNVADLDDDQLRQMMKDFPPGDKSGIGDAAKAELEARGGYVPEGDDGDLTEAELQAFIETQPLPEGWTAVVEPGEDENYPASISLLKDGQPVSSERGSTILVTPDGEIEWAGSRGFTEGSLEGYIESYLTDRDPNDSGDIDITTGEPIFDQGPVGDTPEAYQLPDKAGVIDAIPAKIREAGANAGGKRQTQANRVAANYEQRLAQLNGEPGHDQPILQDIAIDMSSRGYVGNEVDEELFKEVATAGGLTSSDAVVEAMLRKYEPLTKEQLGGSIDGLIDKLDLADDEADAGGNSIPSHWKNEGNSALSEEQWQAASDAGLHPAMLEPGPDNLVHIRAGKQTLEGMFDPDTGAKFYKQNSGDWIQYGPEEGEKPPGGVAESYPKQTNHGKTPPWEGGAAAGDDPFPDDQIPEGWTKQVEPENQWGDPEQTYLMGPEELGEAGMIAVSTEDGPFEPGTYWLPGQAEDQQGPFTSLEEAITAAELGNPWGDLPNDERPEVDLGDNPDGVDPASQNIGDVTAMTDAQLDDQLRAVGFDDEALRNMDRADKEAELLGDDGTAGSDDMIEEPADTGTAREATPEMPDFVGDDSVEATLVGLENYLGGPVSESPNWQAVNDLVKEAGQEISEMDDPQVIGGRLEDLLAQVRALPGDGDVLAEQLQEIVQDSGLFGYSADTEDVPAAKPAAGRGRGLRVPRAGGRTLRAAAPPFDPDAPPAAFFDNPHFKTVAPLTITQEGRVMGHLATWGSCHLTHTARGKCVTPPRSRSGYRYFNTGHVLTKEGIEVGVGQLTVGTGHADEGLNAKATLAHYDNTGTAVADVTVGEDAFGIWFSGALRPGVSAAKVRTLRASPLSGDWRQIGQYPLELVAALAVNVQGFPVPRPSGHVRRGEMVSLVAAGMVPPSKVRRPGTPGALSVDDLRYLKRLAARERDAEHEAQQATLSKAAALSRQIAAREMASRVASSVSAMAGDTQNEGGH